MFYDQPHRLCAVPASWIECVTNTYLCLRDQAPAILTSLPRCVQACLCFCAQMSEDVDVVIRV